MPNAFIHSAPSLQHLPAQKPDHAKEDDSRGSVGSINTAVVVWALFAAFFILLSLNVYIIYGYQTGSDYNDNRMLYFDTESNLPTYFNTFILLLASLVLAVITTVKRKAKDNFSLHWAVLTVIFLGLSVDEALGFHELLMDPLRFMFNLSGIFRFAWVIPGIAAVLVFCFSYFKFFMHLSYLFRLRFFCAGFIYVMGAVGLEMLGGYFFGHASYGRESLAYMTTMTLEESFEMCGIILFIGTLLSYIKANFSEITVSFE